VGCCAIAMLALLLMPSHAKVAERLGAAGDRAGIG
jgi:hypothetical protein